MRFRSEVSISRLRDEGRKCSLRDASLTGAHSERLLVADADDVIEMIHEP